jgi:hypothetical protein
MSINNEKYLICLFDEIYEDWWVPQVELGNIPERKYDTICRCHPNINNDIIFSDIITNLDISYVSNKPKNHFIPTNKNKIIWIVDRLHDIYEDSMYGYQCMDDVNIIHRIFWTKFNNIERQKIKNIFDNTVDTSWADFSLIMCAVYQKSFDHIEIN